MQSEYQYLKDFISIEVKRKGTAIVPIIHLIENFEIDESDRDEMQKDVTSICHRISDDLNLEASFQFSFEFVEFRRIYAS